MTAIATIDKNTGIDIRIGGDGIEFILGGAGLSLLIETECTERYLDIVAAAVAKWRATDLPDD